MIISTLAMPRFRLDLPNKVLHLTGLVVPYKFGILRPRKRLVIKLIHPCRLHRTPLECAKHNKDYQKG